MRGKCLVPQKQLLIKTPKLTMQIHSLNIACDRKSQSKFSNMAPQETVRGRSSPAIKVWERKLSSFWPHGSPGTQGLHAPANLSTTTKSLARTKKAKMPQMPNLLLLLHHLSHSSIREEIRGGFQKPLVSQKHKFCCQ